MNYKVEQRIDFEKSLLRNDVVDYYLSRTKEELEAKFGREVSRMVGFDQNNSHHCYDLWEHSLRTIEEIDIENLTLEQFKMLRVAAFFHDIGKVDVAQFNERTKQQVFYGHPMRSAELSRPLLEKLGYSKNEIEKIAFFIGHHDDFISYKTKLAPFMENHQFIRKIDEVTVAEKIIENKFDFISMGYNTGQIRIICYSLAHGKKPHFKTKNQESISDVDMDCVKEKMNSLKYKGLYDASLEDYKMLLKLCKADAKAQSEVAIQNGKVVGSKKEKLENLTNIEKVISKAYNMALEILK